MIEFWKTLQKYLRAEKPVFVTFVAENTAHSPGTLGAKMLITADESRGTIGGGTMELNLAKRARQILASGKDFVPEMQTLHHRASGPGEKSGMICAGSQTNVYCLCRPEKDHAIVEKIVNFLEQHRSGVVKIDRAGLRLEAQPIDSKNPQTFLEKHEEGWCYVEQLINLRRVAIIGGGHCSLALSRVLRPLGYEISVFDTRPDVATFVENEAAHQKFSIDDYCDAGNRIAFPELTRVIVMTADMKSDARGLLGVAGKPFPFIGVMGSKAKIAAIFKELRAAGISESDLQKITAPVGLPMRSNTPQEIAISVAAQLLQMEGE